MGWECDVSEANGVSFELLRGILFVRSRLASSRFVRPTLHREEVLLLLGTQLVTSQRFMSVESSDSVTWNKTGYRVSILVGLFPDR